MKRIISIGDLHSGSIYGMLPPNFIQYDGTHKPQNPGQSYTWRCWEHFCNWAARFEPDAVEVGGDCVEGPQKKSYGFEVDLHSPDDQVQAAVGTLQYLKDRLNFNVRWFFIKGTPYHVGHWGSAEEAVAKALGGEQYAGGGTGKYCKQVLWLETEGIVIEFAHHVGGASGFYRLTALDRESQWSAMAAKDTSKGIPKADLLIRHHVHFFGGAEHASKQIYTAPCWKLADEYSRKGGVHRFHPDLGGILIEVEGDRKKEGQQPCRVIKQLYDLPAVKTVTL